MLDRIRFKELLTAFLNGGIKEDEIKELFRMTSSYSADDLLEEMMDDDLRGELPGNHYISSQDAERIIKNILASEENTRLVFKKAERKKYYKILSVAAVAVVALLSWVYFSAVGSDAQQADDFMALIPTQSMEKISATQHPLEVKLNDGTTVRLQPNSTISFPDQFEGEREVYLTGEAYFNVAKDPSKPFLVYYNNIVTRVLGTSFTIRTNSKTKNVEVSVRTGKVQVTENARATKGNDDFTPLRAVILKPNQKTVYDVAKRNFEITLADSIYRLVDEGNIFDKAIVSAPVSFYYDQPTGLREIFDQLEGIYGIEIVVTNENIYRCMFTGDITAQDMMKKLQILCLTIGAEYEVNGTKILVSGKGCR